VWEPETLIRELPAAALRQRLLLTHGTADPMLPIARTRAQIPLLQAAGLNVTWREFPKAHTIAGEPELAVIRDFIRAGY